LKQRDCAVSNCSLSRAFPRMLLLLLLLAATGVLPCVFAEDAEGSISVRRPTRDALLEFIGKNSSRPLSRLTRTSLVFGKTKKVFFPRLRAPGGPVSAAQGPTTIRLLALRVDFRTDRSGDSTSTPTGRFDLNPNGYDSLTVDPPPRNRRYFEAQLEAVNRYYADQSRGLARLEYAVYPVEQDSAYHLSDTADYGPWVLNQSAFSEAWRFFSDALTAASASGDTIPFSSYDVYMVFHAGADFQSDVNQDSPRDLPTYFAATDIESLIVEVYDRASGDSVRIAEGFVLPETVSQDWMVGSLYGVIAHEFAHQLGLEDLYNTGGINPYLSGLPMVGVWSLMDSGHLMWGEVTNENTGKSVMAVGVLPPSLDLYSKISLWPEAFRKVNPDSAVWRGTLQAIESDSEYVRVNIDEDEYFLLENRERDLNGDGETFLALDEQSRVILGPLRRDDFDPDLNYVPGNEHEYDHLLPGSGILIWHVDLEARERAHRLGIGINDDPEWRSVALEEADGIQDLGDPSSFYYAGGPYDPFYKGNNAEFGPSSSPSSRTNAGADSRIRIDILDEALPAMAVKVERQGCLPGWPLVAPRGIEPGSLNAADLDGDGKVEVFGCGVPGLGGDSLLYAWTEDGSAFGNDSGGVFFSLPNEKIVSGTGASERGVGGTGLVAVVTDSGNAYLVNGHGNLVAGWPSRPPGRRLVSTPVLLDSLLIAYGSRGIYARSFADSLPDWVTLYEVPDSSGRIVGNLAVGDVDGDGRSELFFTTEEGLAGSLVIEEALAGSGGGGGASLLLKRVAPGRLGDPSLALADMDRAEPPGAEAVLCDSNRVWVVSRSLDVMPGWPVELPDAAAGPVAIGDIDGDGYLEVAVVGRDGAPRFLDGAGGIHPGRRWEGRPEALGAVSGSPLVADADGDGDAEVLFPAGGGLYACVDEHGASLQGWPVSVGRASPADAVVVDSAQERLLFVASESDSSSHLYGLRLAGAGQSRPVFWPMKGFDPERSYSLPFGLLPSVPASGRVIERFFCYPNPCRGRFLTAYYKLGEGGRSVLLELLDQEGRSVFSRRLSGVSSDDAYLRIDTSSLSSGVYLCRLKVDSPRGSSVRFFKVALVH